MNENPLTHNPMKQDNPAGRHKALLVTGAIVLAFVAIAAIAYSVYAWQQNRQLSSDISTKNNQIAELQKQKTTPTTKPTTQPADPYAGWKSYCDAVEKACFKYPADWTVATSSTANTLGMVSASIDDPSHSISGNYMNSDTRDGFNNPYYVADLEELATPSSDLKVLGGFVATTATVYPEYKVVDTSFTASLTAGQQGMTEDTARFTFKDKKTGSLYIRPATVTGMTPDQAKAWFTTDDAKTALLVTKSFYLE